MIIGIIPARQGSKGIPGKNMIDLGGRPLLDYTLAIAERCEILDRIFLSTNISEAIDFTNRHYKRIETPFLRPENLSSSSTTLVEVVLHTLNFLKEYEKTEVDTIVLLQPTCPFRRINEVEGAIRLFKNKKINSLIGVSRVWHHPSDYVQRDGSNDTKFNFVLRDSSWKQRQDFPEVLFMTGALYICRADYLMRTLSFYDQESYLYNMSEETMIDIDSPFDLSIARGLLAGGEFSTETMSLVSYAE